jgi:hypothetical protein
VQASGAVRAGTSSPELSRNLFDGLTGKVWVGEKHGPIDQANSNFWPTACSAHQRHKLNGA